MNIVPLSISEQAPQTFRKVESLADLYYFLAEVQAGNVHSNVVVRDDIIKIFALNDVEVNVVKWDNFGHEIILDIPPSSFVKYIRFEEIKEINDDVEKINDELEREDLNESD